jgi:hypothetical protein
VTPLTIASNGAITSGAPLQPRLPENPPLDGNFYPASVKLSGIACARPDACYVVGLVDVVAKTGGSPTGPPLTISRFAGGGASITNSDGNVIANDTSFFDSTDVNVLTAIDCPTTTLCFAVGAAGLHPRTVAMHVNGEAIDWADWNRVAGATQLNSIDCPTTTTCYAVGYESNNGDRGVVVALSTAAMDSANDEPIATAQAVPGTSELTDITCPTTTTCYASGDNSSNGQVIQFAVNGPSIIPDVTQTVPGTSSLSGIACADASTCFAVGNVITGDGGRQAVVVQVSRFDSIVQQILAIHSLSSIACAGGVCYAAGFNAITGQSVVVTVTPRALIPTTLVLDSSANPVTYADPLTVVAAVVPSSGTNLVGGTVQFTVDGSAYGFPVPVTFTNFQNQASITIPNLPAGDHTISATYSGDDNYAPAASPGFTQTVNKAVLTITADNKAITAGDVIPPLTYTPSGFVNGENAGVLSGAPSLSTTATQASAPGAYPITAGLGTLTAANYSFAFVNGVLTINPANGAPTADAGADQTVVEGATVTLDSSGSSDPDGDPLTYAWELVGHTGPAPSLFSTNEPIPSFVTADNGTATYRLTVSDGKGGSHSDDVLITVGNAVPTATFSAPAAVDEGSTIALSLTNPADAGSADVQAGFSYAFDCGSGYGEFGTSSSATCTTTDSGPRTVRGQIRDKDGGVSEYSKLVTVNNVAPAATFNAPAAVNEGGSIVLSLTGPSDVSAADTAAGFSYAFDCGDGFGAFEVTNTTACETNDSGARTVKGRIRDKDGGVSEYTRQVTIDNVAPSATFNAPASVAEGSAIALSLANPADPSTVDAQAGFSYAFDCGSGYGAFGSGSSAACAAGDDGTLAVGGQIRDKDGGASEYSASVTVTNVAPTIGSITAPIDPVPVTTAVSTSATFTDPGASDTHAATWDWGDGTSSAGVVSAAGGSGSVSGSHVYAAAGVYTVTLTVVDDDGGTVSSTYQYVVAYDPDGGFVTGHGWIDSPVGACTLNADCADLAGDARFGFVSKYHNGASVPSGDTQFQFKAGDLEFRSTAYQWLVIAGPKAQYKGSGNINGSGEYSFLLTAGDGQASGGGGVDRFRIKIWETATGRIVYDNQMGDADSADATTAIVRGNIVIHK